MNDSVLIEVCVESALDGYRAAEAGADRIELNSGLALGGLTPTAGQFQALFESVSIPIVVMLRPRNGGFVYSKSEFLVMRRDAEMLLEWGASGIVFGCLNEQQQVDAEQVQTLVKIAADRETVFHRAFDCLNQQVEVAKQLIDLGVTRILTSGGCETAIEGTPQLRLLQSEVGEQIEILPAAGIRAANATELLTQTGCRQIHGTLSQMVEDSGRGSEKEIEFVDFRSLEAKQLRRLNLTELEELISAVRSC